MASWEVPILTHLVLQLTLPPLCTATRRVGGLSVAIVASAAPAASDSFRGWSGGGRLGRRRCTPAALI